MGESPLLGYRLPAGRHVVRVHNPHIGVERTLSLEIRPGEVTRRLVEIENAP